MTSDGWTRLAHSTTDVSGYTRLEAHPLGKGLHLFRVYVDAGTRYGEAWSQTFTVEVWQRVKLAVETPSSTWPAGRPIPVKVTVSDATTTYPVAGVPVDVLVNGTPAGTIMSGADGSAVILLPLPSGSYTISADTSIPFLEVEEAGSEKVEVRPVVSQTVDLASASPILVIHAPPLVESNKELIVRVHVSVSGSPVQPDRVELEVEPAGMATLEGWDGWSTMYRIVLPSPGVYTITARVQVLGFMLHASTGVTVVDFAGRLDEWSSLVEEALGRVDSMISEISASLQTFNTTRIEGMLESLNDQVGVLLLQGHETNRILADVQAGLNNTSMAIMRLGNQTTLLVADIDEITSLLQRHDARLAALNGSLALLETSIGRIAVVVDDSTRTLLEEINATTGVLSGEHKEILTEVGGTISRLERLEASLTTDQEDGYSQVAMILSAVLLIAIVNLVLVILLTRKR